MSSESAHRRSSTVSYKKDAKVDEYTSLVTFMSDYRENGTGSKEEGKIVENRVWYAPWKKRKFRWKFVGAGQEYPEEWSFTDIHQGLSDSDVEARRRTTGFNELTAKKTNQFRKVLNYFQGPILYVMEIALLLAAGLSDWVDFGVIIGILALNATVGWYQEKQAEDVVASLKADIAMRSTVVRNGQEIDREARELVPGDVIIIEESETVPADAKVVCDYEEKDHGWDRYQKLREEGKLGKKQESQGEEEEEEDEENNDYPVLSCDHSAITGESLAVDRFAGDDVYYTTGCKRGKAYGIVQATGPKTFVGRTAAMVQGTSGKGHFQIVMDSIGTSLLVLVMACQEKAIVQKLTAIESLAGVDILCSDKTGTLTANQLSIREPYVAEGIDINWMFAVAALASSHNVRSLDPIDKVTILSVNQYPKAKEILQQGWKTESFTPFDPVSKRIVSVVSLNGEKYTCTKGAPKAVLQLTQCSEETARLYREKATEFAHRGFRSLGVAVQKEGEEWSLLGMMPMFDPPREDTASTIAEAQDLGIKVKMLTGDATAIAKETCKMLALGTRVYNSERLISGGLNGAMAGELLERADGFAEVFPEHKYQVVDMLQERGHLTAMTGDGVNDAPSLKKADCGIAVEGASEAAQSASDIVFLEPGLSTIIDSIKVARQIFQRMKAYIQYRIALCLHLEIYLVTTMIIINESIRTELVVFLALFADLATVAVAYDNASYERRPVEWQLPKIWVISVILGILLALGTWVIRGTLFLPNGGFIQNWGSIQEIVFLEVALTENWLIFVTRGGAVWPSLPLITAIAGVDALATCFCLFGWFSNRDMITDPFDKYIPMETANGWTNVVDVVRLWAYCIGVEIVIALVYFALNKWKWLDDLGRTKRSKGDVAIGTVLSHLSTLSLEFEKDQVGHGRIWLGQSKEEEELD
ncbi:hypothetical protein N7444_002473 [Penicillium canescens]|nr:hypothetical protein N7444_002473 [Penicillium canescens]